MFSKALFEGLIFGVGYIWRGFYMMGICVTKLIGLAESWNTNKRSYVLL